ncbi:MAG: DUF4111 domain-containing protein [Theionarchaea archaeon]|nr:DUF4111 domain-containing protein [Theionarchaea archaeon]
MNAKGADDISLFLDILKEGILKCLKSVVAIYVYGSLVMDDFMPHTSDIDFIVIVDSMTRKEGRCLEKLHERLERTHVYGRILEGDYIPLSHLSPEGGIKTHYGYERVFDYKVPGDVISPDTLIAIMEKSITVYGPPPADIIPQVKREDLAQYMVNLLKEYADEYEEDRECYLDPRDLASDVLNMCRSLHANRRGEIISKSEAASLALKEFPQEWSFLIQAAVSVRSGQGSSEDAEVLRRGVRNFAGFLTEKMEQGI